MRTSRSIPVCAQLSGVAAARESASTRASAPSGAASARAVVGKAQGRPVVSASTNAIARRCQRSLAESGGGADFDNVHLGECVWPIAVDRPAVLGEEDASGHQVELFLAEMDQRGHRDPQRQAVRCEQRAGHFKIDEPIVGDDRSAAWYEVLDESTEKAVEHAPAVRPTRAPAPKP